MTYPWAGYTTLEQLQKRLDEPAPVKFGFELHTPTAFGWKDDYIATMPVPKLVFGSLARAWREISGEDNIRSVEEYAEQNLIFGTFDLSTQAVMLHNKTQLGAVGRFEYMRTDETDQPLARGLNLLADLAFYSGLGRKTPQGMGQASRLVR